MCKVSVITYVYVGKDNNRLKLLDRAIKSVSSQNFESYEHLIVDDGSDVNLQSFIEGYADKRIKYIGKKRTGIVNSTYTYNMGFECAKGSYLIILSSDDEQLPQTLKVMSDFLDNNHCIGVLGAADYIDVYGNKRTFLPDFVEAKEELVYRGNFINGCAIMFRREAFDLGMRLPPNICGFCADYDMWVRLSEVGDICRINDKVVNYYDHTDTTRKKTRGNKNNHRAGILPGDRHRYFEKSARLKYVVNSALKRRFEFKNKGKNLFIRDPYVEEISTFPESLGQAKDELVLDCGAWCMENLDYFKYSSKSWESNIKSIREYLKKTVPSLNEYSTIVLDGVGASAALISHAVEANVHLSLYMKSSDLNNYWVDHINWAFINTILTVGYEASLVTEALGLDDSITEARPA